MRTEKVKKTGTTNNGAGLRGRETDIRTMLIVSR